MITHIGEYFKLHLFSACDIDELVVPPKFTKLLSDVLVREGDTITLECNANGCPKPEFKWVRNTVEIKPDQRITVIFTFKTNFHAKF